MESYLDKITNQLITPIDNLLSREYDSTVSMGSLDYVIIEKLYGPYSFRDLRITCNTYRGGWVIEVQEDYPENYDVNYIRKWVEIIFISENKRWPKLIKKDKESD